MIKEYIKMYNVFDCERLEILFESEDENEVIKRLAEEKVKGKDVIEGLHFK